jgi:hypothetical protein
MMKWLRCWFSGHDPILREDMEVHFPERWIPSRPDLTIHVMPRDTHVGETTCRHCGVGLWVEGISTRVMKQGAV